DEVAVLVHKYHYQLLVVLTIVVVGRSILKFIVAVVVLVVGLVVIVVQVLVGKCNSKILLVRDINFRLVSVILNFCTEVPFLAFSGRSVSFQPLIVPVVDKLVPSLIFVVVVVVGKIHSQLLVAVVEKYQSELLVVGKQVPIFILIVVEVVGTRIYNFSLLVR
ncbi:hypothetical protein L9F63_022558, partial [Diploptera punctata]